MEFDINRVYTAVNADKVKPGSKVFVADDLDSLRQRVGENYYPETLSKINLDNCTYRFATDGISYALCYFVAEPNEPRRMTNRELARWLVQGNGQLRLRSGDISTYLIYTKDDSYVPIGYMIRGWDETEWREPVIEEEE